MRRTAGFGARRTGTAVSELQPVVDLHTPFLRGSVFGVARGDLTGARTDPPETSSPEVCSFQLPEVCSFRLPLTNFGRRTLVLRHD